MEFLLGGYTGSPANAFAFARATDTGLAYGATLGAGVHGFFTTGTASHAVTHEQLAVRAVAIQVAFAEVFNNFHNIFHYTMKHRCAHPD